MMVKSRWALARAIGFGSSLGFLTLLLWPFLATDGPLLWAFVLLATLSGLCGATIVFLTMFDLTFHRPRGERLRPVRTFDLVLGWGLFLLALLQIRDAIGGLPA